MREEEFNVEEEYGNLLDLLEMTVAEVDNELLAHYGIKGMKWGVRRDQSSTPREPLKSLGPDSVSRKTASGETITLQKIPPNKLNNFLGRTSKRYREGYSKRAELKILDSRGKKIGEASVQKKNNEELYLNWLGINKSARGKGYATAVMKAGRDFGKQEGFKKMILEVPGNSPDAKHIYEKLGFKVTGQDNGPGTEMWGGLTNMEYSFDKVKHSQGSSNEILHYGVRGMKWGVRRAETNKPNARYREKARAEDKHLYGKGGVKRINRRMNKGKSLNKARSTENKVVVAKTVGAVGAIYAANYLKVAGPVLSQIIAQKAHAKRGEAFARNTFADNRGIGNGTFKNNPKQNRKGVYNISSL